MNNPNTVNHSKELFSDKYAEAILKIAKTLTQKPPFVKNTLNDLDMWVGKEPTKKDVHIYTMRSITNCM